MRMKRMIGGQLTTSDAGSNVVIMCNFAQFWVRQTALKKSLRLPQNPSLHTKSMICFGHEQEPAKSSCTPFQLTLASYYQNRFAVVILLVTTTRSGSLLMTRIVPTKLSWSAFYAKHGHPLIQRSVYCIKQ